MSLDFVNRHVAKILLAVEDGDSINRISTKTGSSYSYTYEWIKKLEEAEVVERDDGVRVVDEEFFESFRQVAKTVLKKDLELDDAYLLPNFAGMEYRFSKLDAVYIWTKGGYQIGRNKNDYPIFIDVHKNEVEDWKTFLQGFGVKTSVEDRREDVEGIYFVLNPVEEGFSTEYVENAAVSSLAETVEWMQQYRANFQPALEMVDEMYDLKLGVEYRERNVM